MKRSRLGSFDIGNYGRAVALLVRTPSLMLGPLAAAVITQIVLYGSAASGFFGPAQGWLAVIVLQVVHALGLGLAVAIADNAWRSSRDAFGYGLDRWKRRIGDLAIAGIGVGFIIWAAGEIGSVFAIPYLEFALELLAIFFFVFTIPAATIGGVPGGASLQVSLERARANPLSAGIAAVIFFVLYFLAQTIAVQLFGLLASVVAIPNIGVVYVVSQIVAEAIGGGYLGAVLAKSYNDASYGRIF